MRIVLLILLGLSINFSSLACTCKKKKDLKSAQLRDYENSDLIFSGNVLDIASSDSLNDIGHFNDIVFHMSVTEVFKGEMDSVVTGYVMSSCDGVPSLPTKEASTGKWLVYADSNADGSIHFSICGLTRSMDNPQFVLELYTPAPPSIEEMNSPELKQNFEVQKARLKEEATADLLAEISWLRSLK